MSSWSSRKSFDSARKRKRVSDPHFPSIHLSYLIIRTIVESVEEPTAEGDEVAWAMEELNRLKKEYQALTTDSEGVLDLTGDMAGMTKPTGETVADAEKKSILDPEEEEVLGTPSCTHEDARAVCLERSLQPTWPNPWNTSSNAFR